MRTREDYPRDRVMLCLDAVEKGRQGHHQRTAIDKMMMSMNPISTYIIAKQSKLPPTDTAVPLAERPDQLKLGYGSRLRTTNRVGPPNGEQ